MKTIVFDTESNGMQPEQVCQLSYIISEDGLVTGRNFFFSVDCMNDYAFKKHKLSKRRLYDLSGGRRFKDRFDDISRDFMDADMFCGHNVAADIRIMNVEFSRLNTRLPENARHFCTMKHYDNAMHLKGKTGQHKPPRLDELCRYFLINRDEIEKACEHIFGRHGYMAHDARYDATATYLCISAAQRRGDIRGVI